MESTKTKEKLENLTVDSLIYLTIRELNLLGQYYGLDDVSEDSNLRTLQLLMWFDLRAIPGRQGHDARDKEGLPWELKASKTGRVFSTSHHLTRVELVQALGAYDVHGVRSRRSHGP